MAVFSFHSLLVLPLCIILTHAATFEIRNRCTYTVWAGAIPGGGRRLDSGQAWVISAQPGVTQGRIWPRTGCDFDADGNGQCETGDCGGVLECKRSGEAPNTVAEYSLKQFGDFDYIDISQQFADFDYMDISLVDGFNVPMEFSGVSGCNKTIRCAANIVGECPIELKAPGGCNNPCTVFKTDEYCCTNSAKCSPTNLSRFFKDRCPDVYSYPKDDQTRTFNCPTGSNYRIVFCPDGRTPSALPTMAQIIVIF